MAETEGRSAKEMFLDFARQRGIKMTSQRMAIVDAAFGTGDHFTADQLLDRVRQKDGSVSRATVYRTLHLLTESRLVREIDFGRDQKYYDPNYALHPNHHHIICQDCDRILEFEDGQLEEREGEITRRMGFALQSQRIQITAHCEKFLQSGSCERKDGG